MKSLLVIANSGAGTADREALATAVEVLSAQASVEVVETGNPGELDGVLHRVGPRRIVVAGGDGSLHAVVSALHKRRELEGKVLGLLPLGTGNDFARHLEIPLEIEEAARVCARGRTKSVDLLVDEVGSVVVNHVHVGAGAQASRRGSRWKDRLGSIGVGKVNLGRLGYPIGVVEATFMPPSVRLRVEVDGEVVNDFDQPVLMVAVGVGSSVGGGAELTPDAQVGDGCVDVMISRAIGPVAKLGYAVGVLRRRHQERDDVRSLRGQVVSISGEPFFASADGEIYGPERSRTWRVEPAAYSVLVP